MSLSYLDNISQSTYTATQAMIENCKISPTGSVFSDVRDTEHEEYEQSHSKWCTECNNAYHRTCDDKFQSYRADYGIDFQKHTQHDVDKLKALCDIPVSESDIKKLSLERVKTLKQKTEHISRDLKPCLDLRHNHHKHCIRHKTTKVLGPDEDHKHWITSLKNVQAYCARSYERLKRIRPQVDSR